MRFSLPLFLCILLVVDSATTTKKGTTSKKTTVKKTTTKKSTTPPPLRCFHGMYRKNGTHQVIEAPGWTLPKLTDCPADTKCCTSNKITDVTGDFAHYFICNSVCGYLGDREIAPVPLCYVGRGEFECRGAVGPCYYGQPPPLRCYEGEATLKHTALTGGTLPKLIECPRGNKCCRKYRINDSFRFECHDDCPRYGLPTDPEIVLSEYPNTVLPIRFQTVCRGPFGPCDAKKTPPPPVKCFIGGHFLNETKIPGTPLPTLKTCPSQRYCCMNQSEVGPKTQKRSMYDCASSCPAFGNEDYRTTKIGQSLEYMTMEYICRTKDSFACKYVKTP